MNIILIDDDVNFLEILKVKLGAYAKLLIDNFNIDISMDISILNNKMYSIYFLDIDLNDKNGINIAKKIKYTNHNAIIIFVTAKNDLIYNAITIQPFYFIRKSHLDDDLKIAFSLLKAHFNKKEYYSFKYDSDNIKVYIDDIIYFETEDHLTSLYTTFKHYHIYKPLKTLLNEINSPFIVQANRKQCFNLSHVSEKKKNYLILDNNITIKIGNKYKNNINSCLESYQNGDFYDI